MITCFRFRQPETVVGSERLPNSQQQTISTELTLRISSAIKISCCFRQETIERTVLSRTPAAHSMIISQTVALLIVRTTASFRVFHSLRPSPQLTSSDFPKFWMLVQHQNMVVTKLQSTADEILRRLLLGIIPSNNFRKI